MPCADSLPLKGAEARFEIWVPVSATGGFAATEIGRIFVPPSSEPLALEVDIMAAAVTAGQTTDMILAVAPASTPNLLGAAGGRRVEEARSLTALANFGEQMKFTVWPPDGTVWPPGDYLLLAQRGANAGQVGGTAIAPGFFWWHR